MSLENKRSHRSSLAKIIAIKTWGLGIPYINLIALVDWFLSRKPPSAAHQWLGFISDTMRDESEFKIRDPTIFPDVPYPVYCICYSFVLLVILF